MSDAQPQRGQPNFTNIHSIDSSEAKKLLTEIRGLRRRIVDAWQERAVVLTREEQLELKAEIADTCEILRVLTQSA